MDLTFRVTAHIARPVAEVFEAVADPAQLSRYFTTGGAQGRMQTGAVVTWDFADFPGAFPVWVVDVIANRQIVFEWAAEDGSDPDYRTTVSMTFAPLEDGRTQFAVEERGWRQTPSGLKASYGNCQGWSQMQCALKAFLEHGINLREGMYK